jgi:ABC-type antimicrobial peptide transport system permease subunit
VAGLLLGGALAWLGGRALRGLLYQVSPTDPVTLAGAALFLLAVSAVAAWLPARRATRVDPMEALRAE